jgi:hypothetical protein
MGSRLQVAVGGLRLHNLANKMYKVKTQLWPEVIDRRHNDEGAHQRINGGGRCSTFGGGGEERGRIELAHDDWKLAFIATRPWWGRVGMTPICQSNRRSDAGTHGHSGLTAGWAWPCGKRASRAPADRPGPTRLKIQFFLPGQNL